MRHRQLPYDGNWTLGKKPSVCSVKEIAAYKKQHFIFLIFFGFEQNSWRFTRCLKWQKIGERRDSNQGLLGEKHKRYFSALLSQVMTFVNNYAPFLVSWKSQV